MFGADCDPIARQTVGTGWGRRYHVWGSGLMLNAMGRVFFTLRALAGSNPSSCALLKCARKEKAPLLGLIPSNGGGGGIRTLVTLYRPNGFRDRRIQPLCHPSAWGKNKAGSKACFGINWRRVRDLNPGDAFDAYTISNRAPSATRTTLR